MLETIKVFFNKAVLITKLTANKFNEDLCLEQSASLAYITIISLIPLSVLLFSISGILGIGKEIIEYVENTVFPFIAPEFHEQLSSWLNLYISPTAFQGLKTGIVNLVAILSLILAATAIFVMAERVFNHIWNTKENRSYFQKVLAFWVVITTSPLLILISAYLMNYLNPAGGILDQMLHEFWLLRILYIRLVPLLISFLAFSLLYLIIPSALVRIKSAAFGGIIAAVLWELSKNTFYLYVNRAEIVTSFYKSLAAIPLFLIWVYLTWFLILLGAELAYVFQHNKMLIHLRQYKNRQKIYSDPFIAVMLLLNINESFVVGEETPTLDNIAEKLGCNPLALNNVADILVENEYIVPSSNRSNKYFLTKSMDNISIEKVVKEINRSEYPAENWEQMKKDEDDYLKSHASKIFGEANSAYYSILKNKSMNFEEPIKRIES
ncbi:MAG: YihY/virulence factor BrkB family protein [Candidatus Marinimicrobia bacterium]|nr:YihY/virulence factor BrkB family protein [Candidatus Neomarinimicrobiota bacterium]